MYAVGRLGSYIFRGVYTVSGPFRPFGGAVDIIVVEQPDGSFKSSPWYVRFGKFQGVLKTKEKAVSIAVNGVEANFHMFLDNKGKAYFLREVIDVEERESDAVSFPLSSGDETDEKSMKFKSCNHDADESNSVAQADLSNGKLMARTSSRRSRIFGLAFGHRSTKENSVQEGAGGTGLKRSDSLECAEIVAELLELKWFTNLASNRSYKYASRIFSSNDALDNKCSEEEMQNHERNHDKEEKINDEGNQLQTYVLDREQTSNDCLRLLYKTDNCNKQKISYAPSSLENLECSVDEASIQLSCVSAEEQIVETYSLGEGSMENKCKVISNKSGTTDDHSVGNSDHDENEIGDVSGMSDPERQSEYKFESCIDNQFNKEMADKESHVVSPGCGIFDKENVSDSLQASVYCQTSESSVITLDCSSEQTHETLLIMPELGPEVRVLKQAQDTELDSEGALTMSESYIEMVGTDPAIGSEEIKSHTIRITFPVSDLGDQVENGKNIKDVCHPSLESVDDSQNHYGDSDSKRGVPPSASSEDEHFLFSDLDEFKLHEPDDKNVLKSKQGKKMIRAITPTSEQLASLNLKDGMNHITFTISTPMLGKQQVDARIHLWKWNARIVISDVDGTITRSDLLGQFMPLVGRDWSQTGVAHLFSAIKENGYQLLFLSARAISQAYITRQFLVNLKQDGKALPDGPIVISPDGLFPSLYREVIRRAPHEFKIACLQDIKALFPPDCNPFYAGFGNRDTDEVSYLKVGIPIGKIFIINSKGEVATKHHVHTKSYTSLHDIVHGMFPPMATSEQEDFNSWNFWKLPPPQINI